MDEAAPLKQTSSGFDPWALAYPYLGYLPWILLAALACALATAVQMHWQPTLYQATAALRLSDVTKPVSSMVADNGVGSGSGADLVVRTYVDEASSFAVASRTAASLDVSSEPDLGGMDQRRLAESLAALVTVRNEVGTDVIRVSALAETPELAANLANAWAHSFIEEDLHIEHNGAASLLGFLQEQNSKVLSEIEQAKRALKQYSGKNPDKMTEKDLGIQVAALETRVAQMRDEQAVLDSQYRPDYPEVQSHRAELDHAEAELNALLTHSGDEGWLNLVHQLKALQTTNAWLLEKEQEARVSENLSASNILLTQAAITPYRPFSPRRRRAVAMACLAGAAAAFAAVWALVRLRNPVQRGDDLAAATKADLLGVIPDFRLERASPFAAMMLRWRGTWPDREANAAPSLPDAPQFQGTYFRRSFGDLRNRLLQHEAFQRPVCLAVLSPGVQEGRTTVNAGLALALAHAGKKVLLVDANLWRPAVGRLFGMAPRAGHGLAALVAPEAGGATAPVPVATTHPGLKILPSPPGTALGLDWVRSDRLAEQIRHWKTEFNCIVLDPPPLHALSGALDLADLLDGIVVMAQSGRTKRSDLDEAMALARARNMEVFGCLLNRADLRHYSVAHRTFHRILGFGHRRP